MVVWAIFSGEGLSHLCPKNISTACPQKPAKKITRANSNELKLFMSSIFSYKKYFFISLLAFVRKIMPSPDSGAAAPSTLPARVPMNKSVTLSLCSTFGRQSYGIPT